MKPNQTIQRHPWVDVFLNISKKIGQITRRIQNKICETKKRVSHVSKRGWREGEGGGWRRKKTNTIPKKQKTEGRRGGGKKSRKYRRQKKERFIIQEFNIQRRLYSVPQIYSVATSAGLTCLTPCSPGLSFPLKRRSGKDMVLFT